MVIVHVYVDKLGWLVASAIGLNICDFCNGYRSKLTALFELFPAHRNEIR